MPKSGILRGAGGAVFLVAIPFTTPNRSLIPAASGFLDSVGNPTARESSSLFKVSNQGPVAPNKSADL